MREIYTRFGDGLESLNEIAGDLNNRKVPPPSGKAWYRKSLSLLIRQRAYRGDFAFNQERYGEFYGIDAKGDVREKVDLDGPGKVFKTAGVYEPIIAPDLFDRANQRLDAMAKDRSIRKRAGYALTGVLICDHCGLPMFGCKPFRTGGQPRTAYRCNSYAIRGKGTCRQFQVREDRILPFVLTTLRREIDDLLCLTSDPPKHLLDPKRGGAGRQPEPCCTDDERLERLRGLLETNERRDEERGRLEGRRGQLTEKIERAMSARMGTTDPRTRKEYDRMISGWRDEIERIDSDLAAGTQDERLTLDDLEARRAWYFEYFRSAVQIPTGYHFDDSDSEEGKSERVVFADPRKVNEMLSALKLKVQLRWDTREVRTASAGTRISHVLVSGRFQLGQQGERGGRLPSHVLGSSVT